METIKERAEKFAKYGCGENCIFICQEWEDEDGVCSRVKNRVALYTSIAAEQKQIDIERACEWLDWFLQEKVTTPGYEWVCKQVADFRKAMEAE